MSPTTIAMQLKKTGLCICPDYLNQDVLFRLRQDCRLSQSRNDFHAAGIGQGADRQVQTNIRNDTTLWWDRSTGNTVQKQLWSQLDELQLAFNQNLLDLSKRWILPATS
jgi:hypothetical protein